MPSLAAVSREVTGPVLLFDGECGLCQRVVRLLLRLDRRRLLKFAPLQGRTAQSYLVQHRLPTEDFDSLIYVPAWKRREQPEFLLRTDGVIAALQCCGGIGGIAGSGLNCLPARWRDAGYKVIARWRYRVFGRAEKLPLKPQWADRFLD